MIFTANENNLRPPFTPSEAREYGARGGGSPKRRQTLDAKRIMRKMLTGKPLMPGELKTKLKNIGIDTDDPELATTAALLSATIIQKALGGDMDAIKMALEMAGQAITAKDQTDREKLAIERDKLKLLEKQGSTAGDDKPVINITMGINPDESEAE